MKIKFTIICPCYNSKGYIQKAIDSVLNQTYRNLEFILIDDGSTDCTPAILNDYKNKDSRIKIFHKDNGGYCSAINLGLDNVHGDYFLFMGSDDYLDLSLLESIVTKMDNNLPDMLAFKTIQITTNGEKRIEENTNFSSDIFCKENYISFISSHPCESVIFSLRDTSKIFKTSLLGKQRYFGKYGYDADGIFSILFAHKCSSFMVVDTIGYYWTLRSDSLSGKPISYNVHKDRLSNWTCYINDVMKNNYAPSSRDIVYSEIGFYICSVLRNTRFSFRDYMLIKNYLYSYYLFYKRYMTKNTIGKRRRANLHLSFLSYCLNLIK